MIAKNHYTTYTWIRNKSYSNRSAALNQSNRLGLIAGKTSKVEYDKETKLWWLCFLSGKPIEKQINQTLKET